jgi:CRISPR-associated protein Cas2
MLILVCYDIATTSPEGVRRLQRIARLCEDFGIRAQKSVFEIQADADTWRDFRARLLQEFEPREDSLRFYPMDERSRRRIEHHGVKNFVDVRAPLVI